MRSRLERRLGRACLLMLLVLAAPLARAGTVGFLQTTIADGADKPLAVGIWYPARAPAAPARLGLFTQTVATNAKVAGGKLPLVVFSHGTGGWYGEHYDTALALARAGFVVAALSHTGDTYDDQSRATRVSDHPRQLKRLVDYMLGDWPDHNRLNPARVGALGFSSGGFTVLVALGGTPDLARVRAHCEAHPDFFDCGLVRRAGGIDQVLAWNTDGSWVHDDRLRAAVVAAPALGFTFGPEGLAAVRAPIQLWRAGDDRILPNPDYAEAVRVALPTAPEFHLTPHEGHFDFLAPCTPALAKAAPPICQSEPGFDRAAFHQIFNTEVVRFFRTQLSPARP